MKFETKLAKEQKAAKLAYKNRGTVLWVSCEIVTDHLGFPAGTKRTIQGTCRIRHNQQQLRGKVAIKAAKKLSHAKRWYRLERSLILWRN